MRIPQAASMPVERLDSLLGAVWRYRLGLVVAPAGSGKTTLLSRFAARARGPVGWYRAEAWDREEEALLRHLEAALAGQMNGLTAPWRSVADVANALDSWRGERVLLVIDDLHTLEGTPAEAALERLVDYAPPTVTIVAASRVPPRFNLPRLRVSGALVELGSDDLRFRSWEVERLFRDFYQEPLPPEELARLARRTEGWAAGLQLFHLATRGRAPDERRRVLAALGPSSRLMRDYLTRNVLDQLPAELRRFLIETSVLGRLSAPLCDALLGRSESAEMLAELERRNLFTQALADDGVYRYHEVLRSYLQGVLLEELGDGPARERFRRAGRLLAEADALPEALEAFCRGEEWEAAQSLLGRDGGQVAGASSAWVDALPATVLLHDPWLLLASARRLRSEGRFAEALQRYGRAEAAFNGTDPATICRDERAAIATWMDGVRHAPRRDSPSALLRASVTREPLVAAAEAAGLGAGGTLVNGLATLLAGQVGEARGLLLAVAEDEDQSVFCQAAAGLGTAVADMLAGVGHAALGVEGAVASAESLGLEWLARLGRASLALGGGEEAQQEAEAVAAACDAAADRWGAALARLFANWGAVARGRDAAEFDLLIGEFRALGAPVLEAWVRGLGAVAAVRAGTPDAREVAVQAEASARSAGVPAARIFSYLALAGLTGDDADDYRLLAIGISQESGMSLPAAIAADVNGGLAINGWSSGGVAEGDRVTNGHVNGGSDAPGKSNGHANGHGHGHGHGNGNGAAHAVPLRIRLLGGYELELGGQPVDLSAVRPRVRSLLRLLSLHADAPVHHEAIEAALWPAADATGGTRNLHVAVAALRRALEPTAARTGFQLVRREGDAYRLVLPIGSQVDLQRFEHALAAGRAARELGDLQAASELFAGALTGYGGDLLPEEGPAEWVTERRELCRLAAVEAAQALAELLLHAGDAAAAARVCAHGLRLERYHDPLWRLLIQARDHAGDQGAASRARLGYGRMLAELEIELSSPSA